MGKIVELAYFCAGIHYKRALMINHIFFISGSALSFGDLTGAGENVYYSFPAVPGVEGSIEKAYNTIEQARLFPLALALEICQPLSAADVRQITACLFIPGYLRIGQRPLINLSGRSAGLLQEAATLLRVYISEQGYEEPIINLISPGELSFHAEAGLEASYVDLLNSEKGWGRNIYIYLAEGQTPHNALVLLQKAEMSFREKAPLLYALIRHNSLLEKELGLLREELSVTVSELAHQRQYVEVLRSGNAARELQDYYTREYEILPLWYKRLGHVLKVLSGKRTFRSLFRDDVKKYKA